MNLSEHFSFEELTVTSNIEMQAANRQEAQKFLPTLRALAALLERVRDGKPLVVNSAFRSGALNKATAGSSATSQHPMGQAADIHRPGQEIEQFFKETLALLKREKIQFGQLIDESASRGYGVVRWVHISLGRDFWKPERCGEVLRKWDEKQPDGTFHPKYEMIEQHVNQEV
jgi:hypothetical protein